MKKNNLIKKFFILALGFGVFYVCFFVYFLYISNHIDSKLPDGNNNLVVIFTGAPNRIQYGINIAHKTGNAVLISGVHSDSSTAEVLRRNGIDSLSIDQKRFYIGRFARNTYGNAVEADTCAMIHNYDSIILVTSRYHMPRAIKLLQLMTDLPIYPYPEDSVELSGPSLLANLRFFNIVFLEYNKYLKFKVDFILMNYYRLFNLHSGK